MEIIFEDLNLSELVFENIDCKYIAAFSCCNKRTRDVVFRFLNQSNFSVLLYDNIVNNIFETLLSRDILNLMLTSKRIMIMIKRSYFVNEMKNMRDKFSIHKYSNADIVDHIQYSLRNNIPFDEITKSYPELSYRYLVDIFISPYTYVSDNLKFIVYLLKLSFETEWGNTDLQHVKGNLNEFIREYGKKFGINIKYQYGNGTLSRMSAFWLIDFSCVVLPPYVYLRDILSKCSDINISKYLTRREIIDIMSILIDEYIFLCSFNKNGRGHTLSIIEDNLRYFAEYVSENFQQEALYDVRLQLSRKVCKSFRYNNKILKCIKQSDVFWYLLRITFKYLKKKKIVLVKFDDKLAFKYHNF